MRALMLKSPRNCMHQNEASDSRKLKKCQDEKATGNGKAGNNGQLLHVLIQQTKSFIYKKCN